MATTTMWQKPLWPTPHPPKEHFMSSKFFQILDIAATLLGHLFADLQAGDPLVKDIEDVIAKIKGIISGAQAAQPAPAPAPADNVQPGETPA
jgi:hypothetical protein